MNTPTHLLVSTALLSKPGAKHNNQAVIAGALFPDLSIYALFVWNRMIMGMPEERIWADVYYSPFWQSLGFVSNSLPLFAVGLAVGLWRRIDLLTLFCLSALLHVAFDFPVHNDDAHAHFWPITDWKFVSPVSYWNPEFYGVWVMAIELLLAITLSVVVWNRFTQPIPRIAIAIGLASYIAVPAYFIWSLGLFE